MKIVETERLVIREMVEDDAEFILELLNTPKFLKYIGDRSVCTLEESAAFIKNRYQQSYRDHGYGLYTVELINREALSDVRASAQMRASASKPIGICGFVRRDTLPDPDIGFAFLPEYEGKGYGFESAQAVLKYGREVLGFTRVLAITSQDNDASGRLLAKIGFDFERLIEMPDGEILKLFSADL